MTTQVPICSFCGGLYDVSLAPDLLSGGWSCQVCRTFRNLRTLIFETSLPRILQFDIVNHLRACNSEIQDRVERSGLFTRVTPTLWVASGPPPKSQGGASSLGGSTGAFSPTASIASGKSEAVPVPPVVVKTEVLSGVAESTPGVVLTPASNVSEDTPATTSKASSHPPAPGITIPDTLNLTIKSEPPLERVAEPPREEEPPDYTGEETPRSHGSVPDTVYSWGSGIRGSAGILQPIAKSPVPRAPSCPPPERLLRERSRTPSGQSSHSSEGKLEEGRSPAVPDDEGSVEIRKPKKKNKGRKKRERGWGWNRGYSISRPRSPPGGGSATSWRR